MRFVFAASLAAVLIAGCASAPGAPGPATTAPSADTAGPSAGAGDALPVTGTEYAFGGVPATVRAGTALTFRNDGRELHEMVVLRRNAGVAETFDELLKLPQDQAMKLVAVVGGVQAAPGEAVPQPVVADQPGEYALICFIPQGTTAAPSAGASLPAGPPHFILGMLATFTVE